MVYCVEDDASIRELEIYTLKSMQIEAEGFADAASFFKALKDRPPRLVLLDVMLPDMDGTKILAQIRQNTKTRHIPVIMATAKDSEMDKIRALDAGADDYLTKPFSMMEMVARIKAVLRRCSAEEKSSLISLAGIQIDEAKHQVTVDGREIALTNKEYKLLTILLRHAGRVYERDMLIELVWDDNLDIMSRSLDVHIRTLRSKLAPYENIIKTVRGIGYKVEA